MVKEILNVRLSLALETDSEYPHSLALTRNHGVIPLEPSSYWHTLKGIFVRSRNVSLDCRITKCTSYVRGSGGYGIQVGRSDTSVGVNINHL